MKFLFEYVPSPTIGFNLEYSHEVLAWDFEAGVWAKRSGCRRLLSWDMGGRVRQAIEALDQDEGAVLVVWDSNPWVLGLMWVLDPDVFAEVGVPVMTSDRACPELQDEFLGWSAGV